MADDARYSNLLILAGESYQIIPISILKLLGHLFSYLQFVRVVNVVADVFGPWPDSLTSC